MRGLWATPLEPFGPFSFPKGQQYPRDRELTMADVLGPIMQFERQNKIRVSPEARQLLQLLVDGVVVDPHPAWMVPRSELDAYSRSLADSIPTRLSEIARLERVESTITLYHVAHALSLRLDKWCPIQK